MDCSPPGSSVHGIFQVRILDWVDISCSMGSSRPRDHIHISCIFCIDRLILYHWATWEAVCVCVCVCVSCSAMSNFLQSHGLKPVRLLCPWNSPGKNTGVGSHSLLQGIFPNQGSTRSPAFQENSLPSEPPGHDYWAHILFLNTQIPKGTGVNQVIWDSSSL